MPSGGYFGLSARPIMATPAIFFAGQILKRQILGWVGIMMGTTRINSNYA